MTQIKIPSGVRTIEYNAFSQCTGLTRIHIPAGVTVIQDGAFSGCDNISVITVSKDNPVYDSRENCNAIIETNTDTMIQGCTHTVIPDNVSVIGRNAFSSLLKLESIVIPDSVTRIGESAFAGCSYGKSVVITEENGNSYYIWVNEGLKSVTLSSSVTDIETNAFNTCRALADVYYYGTPDEWKAIRIGDYNEDFQNAEVHFCKKLADDNTGITVDGEMDDVTLTVEKSDDSDTGDIILADGEEITAVYDITLSADGEETQPMGAVTVRIPSENPNAKIYRVEADGSLTDMNAVFKNGYLVFTTDHFSKYIVADVTKKELLGDVDGDGSVTILDATAIQRKLAGLPTAAYNESDADTDGDGTVTILDATAIQRYLADLSCPEEIGKPI